MEVQLKILLALHGLQSILHSATQHFPRLPSVSEDANILSYALEETNLLPCHF